MTLLSESQVLEMALGAHGGLERWHSAREISATLALTGALFDLVGQPGGVGRTRATVSTQEPALVFEPFANADRGRFAPDIVSVTGNGQTSDRRSPRLAFADGRRWDELHLLYFTGYAIWNYLCSPFLLTWPGFTVDAVAPWTEGSETWHRLDVTVPPTVPTHNPTQRFYFDSSGLLRRLDYQPEVLGTLGAPVAHYCHDHQLFDGILVPTRRRVHLRRDDGTADLSLDVVHLDIEDVEVKCS